MRSVLGVASASDRLPWARPFRRRCRARLDRGESHGYHGRCDLARGHVLERGMDLVRFRAKTTNAPTLP